MEASEWKGVKARRREDTVVVGYVATSWAIKGQSGPKRGGEGAGEATSQKAKVGARNSNENWQLLQSALGRSMIERSPFCLSTLMYSPMSTSALLSPHVPHHPHHQQCCGQWSTMLITVPISASVPRKGIQVCTLFYILICPWLLWLQTKKQSESLKVLLLAVIRWRQIVQDGLPFCHRHGRLQLLWQLLSIYLITSHLRVGLEHEHKQMATVSLVAAWTRCTRANERLVTKQWKRSITDRERKGSAIVFSVLFTILYTRTNS